MLYEDLRYLHEDLERLESAVADRVLDDNKHLRNRLINEHEISSLLQRIQSQSERALHIYNNEQQSLLQEVQNISTGDALSTFYEQLEEVKNYHKRYPNESVEILERAYRKPVDGGPGFAGDVDGMFTGEEAFGRFFDLTQTHEEYLNLPGIKGIKRPSYIQFLDTFDTFTPPQCPISRHDRMTEQYFSYVTSLAQYLESFIKRTKPLEDLERLFQEFDQEFESMWEEGNVPGWEEGAPRKTNGTAASRPVTEGTGEGVWCPDCEKEFKNDNVYKAHLTGKKHIKNAEARKEKQSSSGADVEDTPMTNGPSTATSTHRLKEKAVAEREHRIRKLTSAMKTEREDTRVNVERKAGMTDRERQQELAALYAEDAAAASANGRNRANGDEDEDSEGEEKVYNPLKLPLAWDGKPIPFWLYKLHGLGVEFSCEICGNYVYMGRRAFDKHFSEARHIYGLKCLGITNTSLFREITGIEEAQRLWEKIKRDREREVGRGEGVVEMEDSEGNVMPQRVYEDLRKQGLL